MILPYDKLQADSTVYERNHECLIFKWLNISIAQFETIFLSLYFIMSPLSLATYIDFTSSPTGVGKDELYFC